LDLRKRCRGAQDLDLKGGFTFFEWPMTQGGRWGLYIVPTSKRIVGRVFTEQVWWNSLEVGLGARLV
jgi:hypothetical protein